MVHIMKSKSNAKEISCGMALTGIFKELDQFKYEDQKKDMIQLIEKTFKMKNVPEDYAQEMLDTLKSSSLKNGLKYIGNVVMAGMGLRANI